MGIVRFALRFPHTFYVVAALILFLGVAAIRSMPTDIFPEIRIPVVTVIWQYTGLTTPEMEQRVSTYSQYSISANVSGIKNMEAQTLNGLSIQKIYFQPDVNLDLAIAQIVSATNSIRALMPPGIQPPIVVQFNASSVPVLQLSLNSDNLNEQQLYDFGIYRVRQQLAPVPGVTLPTPAGGKYRQIMVDIDPDKLLSRGLTPLDIVNAVNTQNLTLPSGTAKIGNTQYTVRTNATPATIDDLNKMPVKFANGATIFVEGRGAGPRRVAGAAEHRARGRPPLGPAQHHQERQCLHAGGRQRRQEGARRSIRAAAPAGTQDQRAVRPVGIRDQLGQRRAARRRHRGGPHRADDPDLPRLLALDAGGDDFDPAGDPVVARRAVFSRRNAQHHDARRPCAGGRHIGRRLRPSPSKIPIACGPKRACRFPRRRCTAPPKSRCRRWFRRLPSVACSPRWCSSTDRPSICSRRLDLPSYLRCWLPTDCRGR